MFGLLRILKGPEEGRLFSLIEGQTVKVGRSRSCQLMLPDDPYMAREHCQLTFEKGEMWLVNHSSNGTLVNGQPITKYQLQAGDVIQIGETTLSFRWSEEDQTSTLNSGDSFSQTDSSTDLGS
jgi:pSer/pThr/pTyr-binding forkhead associated (FHA) protein